MAIFGGSRARKNARQNTLAQDESSANNSTLPCKKPVTTLNVNVIQSDTGKVLTGIQVKAASTQVSSSSAGLADFGEVVASQTEIKVQLTGEQKKQFETQTPTSKLISEGTNLKTSVALDPVVYLNISIMKWDIKNRRDTPCNNINWSLNGQRLNETGSAADGLINVRVPFNTRQASLKITLPPSSNTTPALVSRATSATTYPAPVQHESWDDVNNFKDMKKNRSLDWNLYIDDLNAGEDENDINARLHNMGFNLSGEKGVSNAIKAYQALYLKDNNGSGLAADIKEDIIQRHDKP
ncbi:MAG TPA: hypothetical protein ENJ08_14065 [Gammaproteobacteria bacterium]|nr:hypothetical protein [Gammaproteobacteria bacterium]